MEQQHPQKPQGLNAAQESMHQAPDTLLATILGRVDHLHAHQNQASEDELLRATHADSWDIRAISLHALGERKNYSSLDPFLEALHDEDMSVRITAVQAFARSRTHIPLEQWLLALRDHDWQVRERAVMALADCSSFAEETRHSLLLAALQDSHEAVRKVAQEAMHRLGDVSSSDTKQHVHSQEKRAHYQRFVQSITHSWLVLTRQFQVLKSYWVACFIVQVLSYSIVVFTIWQQRNVHNIAFILTLVTTLSSAMGIAFTSNARLDAGLEITLSTPTSLRLIIFCRFLIVIGSHLLLSLFASIIVAQMYAQGVWSLVQFWLGPMLFASSLTLAAALLIGSWLSFLLTFVLELLPLGSDGQVFLLHWQDNSALSVWLALVCLLFTFLYLPKQIRLLHNAREI